MWAYLHHVAELLQNLRYVLQNVTDEGSTFFRRGLGTSLSKRTFNFSANKIVPRAATTSKSMPYITGDDGKLLPAVLEYFTEGILPLLHVFYTSFFNPSGSNAEDEIKISVEIASALVVSNISLYNVFNYEPLNLFN